MDTFFKEYASVILTAMAVVISFIALNRSKNKDNDSKIESAKKYTDEKHKAAIEYTDKQIEINRKTNEGQIESMYVIIKSIDSNVKILLSNKK